jgi:hypothetical protein
VNFDVTGELLIVCSVFIRQVREKQDFSAEVYQLFIDFKETPDVGKRFCIPFSVCSVRHSIHETSWINVCIKETLGYSGQASIPVMYFPFKMA